jgi:hypothetical protein
MGNFEKIGENGRCIMYWRLEREEGGLRGEGVTDGLDVAFALH